MKFDSDYGHGHLINICSSYNIHFGKVSFLLLNSNWMTFMVKYFSCIAATRTDVNLNDLGIAFDQLGIQLCELEDYVHQVEPINFQNSVPQFHSDTITAIQFPTNDEILVREEWYDEYMPPLGNKVEKDEPEKATMEGDLFMCNFSIFKFHFQCS